MNAPMRAARRWVGDTLVNLITGLGTARDKTQSDQFGIVELTQPVLEAMYRGDWVARKIVKCPADDATREWRAWQAENDQIELIEEVERKFHIQLRTRQALIKARLYGGAALILGVDDGKDPAEELDIESVRKDSLKFVHAVSRHELGSEGPGLEEDLMSPYFGQPKMYVRHVKGHLTGRILIHPSRVVRIMGEDHPDPNAIPDGWGESVLQPVYEAVKNAGLVSASGAQLISELKVDVLKIPDLTQQLGDKESTDLLTARLAYGMMSKSSVNALVLDKDDEWERISAQLAGLPDIIKQYLLIASGAADIPATRMLGQSPTGLNSTGESDTRNYYDRVSSEQVNFLSPALSTLDEVVIRSALGTRDDNIFYTWNPLWQMTDAELADIAKKKADVVKADVDMMLIPTDALAQVRINQVIEDEFYPGIEAAMEDSDGEVVNPKLEAQLEMTRMKGEQVLQAGEQQAELQKQLPKPAPKKTPVKDWRSTPANVDDAQPRTLYVRRDVVNADDIRVWAKEQGLPELVPDLHVTIMYSRTPVDWMKVGSDYNNYNDDGHFTIQPGGVRIIEPMGNGEVIALLFTSSQLSWRHEQIKRDADASWDWPDFQPHITLFKSAGSESLDMPDKVEPYRGKIVLGPEIFETVKED